MLRCANIDCNHAESNREPLMTLTVLSLLLLLCLGLLLLGALLNVLRDLIENNAAEAPTFGDAACEQLAECREPKSQFALRSRAHF
jgi:hypothetical protein